MRPQFKTAVLRLVIAGGLALSLIQHPAAAADEDRLIAALREGLSVDEGATGKGEIYIIGFPNCPWLGRLYRDTRRYLDRVQLHWFFYPPANPAGTDQAAYLAARRDPALLASVMEGSAAVPNVQSDNKYIRAFKTNRSLFIDRIKPMLGRAPSPTLVFRSGSGEITVQRGYPGEMLGEIIATASSGGAERPAVAPRGPDPFQSSRMPNQEPPQRNRILGDRNKPDLQEAPNQTPRSDERIEPNKVVPMEF